MTLKPLLLFLCTACALPLMAQKNYTLTSPDGTLQATVATGSDIRISLSADGETLLAPSPLGMTLAGGEALGANPKVAKVKKTAVDERIASPFYKKSDISDRYNELTFTFRGDYGLIVRLYDDGLAYRFTTRKKENIQVENEQVAFTFPGDYTAYAPYVGHQRLLDFEGQFRNSFENTYAKLPLTQLDTRKLIFLPMLVELPGGRKMVITEADLKGYPGLYLNNSSEAPVLNGVFAPYPKREEQGGHNRLQMLVKERENYIAATEGTRSFPWRVMIISKDDKELLNSDMVYRLAPPSKIADTSWIKPGKVAWEWWNAWNLYDVDFKAGINTKTYKYYIWFASQHGLEYVILDEGWAVNKQADLMQVVPEIDLEELVEYGRERNVGIILWAGYYAFERDMERVVKHYSDMGVKGFKVDFMDRDDQRMVDFLHRAAEVCAENKMLLDFHGVFKPTGMSRTWPNVLNYEGVFGLEQLKWSPESTDMVTYDVTMPFIRMVAGPLDYTQGAMRNASKGNYRPVHSEPMSQGTRCRQLAEYVIFESPITMLCDSPSNYLKEPECIGFIAGVPTVWDETVALTGSVGEYIAIARRAGDSWFIGAVTDWSPRELELDLSFIGSGDYDVESFADGVNADRAACDFKKQISNLPQDRKLKIKMAPGGGYAARIYAR
ncbi:glycoside hydrolase family 97 protein [Alistipes sp.]|uniref:glycoside hydrolase family 97 protein n=1 Tax=Alistipes sp. TaxID=1872444 RepID=UPI003AF9982F